MKKMTRCFMLSFGRFAGSAILLAGLAGCGGSGSSTSSSATASGSPSQPASVSLSNATAWSTFGDSRLENSSGGFILRYTGGSANFASAAALFRSILNGPALDNSVSYQFSLKVRGVNGARRLGITGVQTGQDPNLVNLLDLSQVEDISDGLDHTFTYILPKSSKGLEQLALHFGPNFGGTSLGNPVGSGILVEAATVSQPTAIAARAAAPTPIAEAPQGNSVAETPSKPASILGITSPRRVTGLPAPGEYASVKDSVLKRNGNLNGLGSDVTDDHTVIVTPEKKQQK